MDPDAWFPVTGLAMAVLGAVLGWFVPVLISRIPEPEQEDPPAPADLPETGGTSDVPEEPRHPGPRGQGAEPQGEPAGDDAEIPTLTAPVEPKEPYADIAALPGLAWKCAVISALAGGLVGARLGWHPSLLPLMYLVPVGVALGLVDWRTRLLPTRVIAPSYAALVTLTVLAAAVGGDWDSLVRAGWGWLIAGGTFFVLWFIYPRGMGYGDVRLSGLLGISLGYLGWAELVTGLYGAFLLGSVGGLLLSTLRIVDRKAYPFGPFMLFGALLGVLAGPGVAAWYG